MAQETPTLAPEEVDRLPEIRAQFETTLEEMGITDNRPEVWAADPAIDYAEATQNAADRSLECETQHRYWILKTSSVWLRVLVEAVINEAFPRFRVSLIRDNLPEGIEALEEAETRLPFSTIVQTVEESSLSDREVAHIPFHRSVENHPDFRWGNFGALLHEVLDELVGFPERAVARDYISQRMLIARKGYVPTRLHFKDSELRLSPIDLQTDALSMLIGYFLINPEFAQSVFDKKYPHDPLSPFWVEFEKGAPPDASASVINDTLESLYQLTHAFNDELKKVEWTQGEIPRKFLYHFIHKAWNEINNYQALYERVMRPPTPEKPRKKIKLAPGEWDRLGVIREKYEQLLKEFGAENNTREAIHARSGADYGQVLSDGIEASTEMDTRHVFWVLKTNSDDFRVVVHAEINEASPHICTYVTQKEPAGDNPLPYDTELMKRFNVPYPEIVATVNESSHKDPCVVHIPHHRGMKTLSKFRGRGMASLLHDILDELVGPHQREASGLYFSQRFLHLERGMMPKRIHFRGGLIMDTPTLGGDGGPVPTHMYKFDPPPFELDTNELVVLICEYLENEPFAEEMIQKGFYHELHAPFYIEFAPGPETVETDLLPTYWAGLFQITREVNERIRSYSHVFGSDASIMTMDTITSMARAYVLLTNYQAELEKEMRKKGRPEDDLFKRGQRLDPLTLADPEK